MLKKSMLFALILINFSLAFTSDIKGDNPKKRKATDSDRRNAERQANQKTRDLKEEAALNALIKLGSARLAQAGRALNASENEYGHLAEMSIGRIYYVGTHWEPLWKPFF